MSAPRPGRPAGRFGIDAPWVPPLWIGLALLYVVLAIGAAGSGAPWWGIALYGVGVLFFAAGATSYLFTSLRGKFLVWADELARTPPPSRALDLGCGHGTVAIAVALRWPSAAVTGIDLWRSVDQSRNSPEAAARNLAANGVEDRVRLITGDMTALPFEDATFDLVTASVAIHNVPSASGRAPAVEEAWRVLAPGGTLLVADIRRTGDYARTLRGLGAEPVLRSAGPRMWWSGPWMATRVLRATKRTGSAR